MQDQDSVGSTRPRSCPEGLRHSPASAGKRPRSLNPHASGAPTASSARLQKPSHVETEEPTLTRERSYSPIRRPASNPRQAGYRMKRYYAGRTDLGGPKKSIRQKERSSWRGRGLERVQEVQLDEGLDYLPQSVPVSVPSQDVKRPGRLASLRRIFSLRSHRRQEQPGRF
jgi:hypothetical protein